MENPVLTPHFSTMEDLHRRIIKHIPGKLWIFDHFQKVASYAHHVPVFYTLLTPLFQVIYGSNNIHGGYFETGKEDWIDAQHALTRLLGNAIGLKPEHHVLEVGCGIGGPAVTMARAFRCQITGLNITAAHVRRARRHVLDEKMAEQVTIVQGNALKMPFAEPFFDHAYAIESVSHMPNKEKVISEVARVTRPGARFGLLDACAEDPAALDRHPDYNFFNVTWGVRADEWIRAGEIREGFRKHGFRLLEERDISVQLEPAPLIQAEYARQRKAYIVSLYGEEVFQILIRALEIASELVKARLFTYKLWLGEKEG